MRIHFRRFPTPSGESLILVAPDQPSVRSPDSPQGFLVLTRIRGAGVFINRLLEGRYGIKRSWIERRLGPTLQESYCMWTAGLV